MLMLVGGVFNLIGKLFIAIATAFTGYEIIINMPEYKDKLNSPLLPTFVRLYLYKNFIFLIFLSF